MNAKIVKRMAFFSLFLIVPFLKVHLSSILTLVSAYLSSEKKQQQKSASFFTEQTAVIRYEFPHHPPCPNHHAHPLLQTGSYSLHCEVSSPVPLPINIMIKTKFSPGVPSLPRVNVIEFLKLQLKYLTMIINL